MQLNRLRSPLTAAILRLLALSCLLAVPVSGDVINYQGRLIVDGAPFNRPGRFRFALVGDSGAPVWESGEISLELVNGRYAVRLGDSTQAPAIDAALLHASPPPKLRVLFAAQNRGWAAAGDDVALPAPEPVKPAADAGQNADILAELRAIHALLARAQQAGPSNGQAAAPSAPPKPEFVTISLDGTPSLGRSDASLVLVEFTDFQCPFCIKFDNETFPQIKASYIGTGKLRFVSRPLPLPFHNYADGAARAAVCAQAQGQFWAMRDRLFAADGQLAPEAVARVARDAGLDGEKYRACVAGDAVAASIRNGVKEANGVGISATPTFVLGRATGGRLTGLKIIGAQPFAAFAAEIDRQLAAGK